MNPKRSRSGPVIRPGAGGGADEREAREVETDRARRGTLADHDVELEVLHRRVEDLLDRPRQAVDLVDEQHVAVVEVGEDGGEVAGALERGTAGDAQADVHLGGDDSRQRGLAQPGRAREQQVVGGLAAAARGAEQDLEVLLEPGLADELVEPPGPERDLFGLLDRVGGSRGAARHACGHRQELERLAQQVLDRTRLRAAARRRRALRRARSRGPVSAARTSVRGAGVCRRLGEVELGHLEARSSARRAAAARCACRRPGTIVSAARSSSSNARRSADGRVHREHRQRQLGPDAGGGDERLERVALVARREPVEHHGVFAHVQVREEERGVARMQRRQRARRHVARGTPLPRPRPAPRRYAVRSITVPRTDPITAHLSFDNAAAIAASSLADDAASPLRRSGTEPAPAAASGARHQWHSASASASAASGGSGTSASAGAASPSVCTSYLPAAPSPATASFTSLGL